MPHKPSYVEVPLTKGQITLVSTEDFERVTAFKWTAMWNQYTRSFYAYRWVGTGYKRGTTQYLHRFLMDLPRGDKRQVDHINHDTLDNRRSNIRVVTQSENAKNRLSHKVLQGANH